MKTIINKYRQLSKPMKATIFFIIANIIQKGISLLTAPIFTRLLTKTEYGTYTLFNSWSEIISIFVTLKITEAIFNKTMANKERSKRRTTLSVFQLILTTLCIISSIICIIFKEQLGIITGLTNIYIILMLIDIYFDASIKLWMAYQRFEYGYIPLIIVSIILAILNPLISVTFVLNMSDRSFGRILGVVVTQAIVGAIIIIYNFRQIQIKNIKHISKTVILFNLPLIIHYLSQILLNHSDRIMISKIIDESAVASYGIAYTIGMLLTIVTQSINSAYVPTIYQNLKNKKASKIIETNSKLTTIIAVLIIITFLIIPEIMAIMGGEKYTEAIPCVYPISASILFIFLYTLYANIELYHGLRKYVTIGTCTAAAINIILNFIFIPIYGYIAAGYTTLFCYICYGLFHTIIATRLIRDKNNRRTKLTITKTALLSIIIIASSIAIQPLIGYPIVRYSILTIIVAISIIKRKDMLKIFSFNK